MTTVVPGVYQRRPAHAKALYTAEGTPFFDTGPESAREDLRAFVDEVGDVDRFFLSHAHPDHVSNVGRVLDAYDPEVVVPENEPLDDAATGTGIDLDDADVVEVADDDTVAGARVIEVPGHTDGICGSYLPEAETFLASDVVDGTDRRGLPAGHLLPPPAVYSHDPAAETNLERLLDLDFETAVVTHGSNVTSEARLKLERYLDFANHYRADLLEDSS